MPRSACHPLTAMSSLFENLHTFGKALALCDLASGESVRFEDLSDYLRRYEVVDSGKPTIVGGPPDFGSALRLLSVLSSGRVVVPLSTKLPPDEVRRRGLLVSKAITVCGATGAGTILFTSGSSGVPKAVFHDMEAHVANAHAAMERIPLGVGHGWLLNLPLNHVSGLAVLVRCLLSGATVVFPDSARPVTDSIASPLVSHMSVVAVQLQRLLERGSDISSLTAVLGGGGPFSPNLIDAAVRAGVPLHLTYGMTETASQVATSERVIDPKHVHVGQSLGKTQIAVDPSGEIRVKGPTLARMILDKGEWRDPKDAEGWFFTGDLGEFLPDGELRIIGRRDRMLISGGENIYPESIESILAGVPGVRRVAVVSIPNAEYGQRPVAFIDGASDFDRLHLFLAARLERFVIPDHFLPWPADIAADAAKIDYPALTAQARELVGDG